MRTNQKLKWAFLYIYIYFIAHELKYSASSGPCGLISLAQSDQTAHVLVWLLNQQNCVVFYIFYNNNVLSYNFITQ